MAKKYIPSPEELKILLEAYENYGTYSKAAKAANISVSIATRIIKENIQEQNDTEIKNDYYIEEDIIISDVPPIMTECFLIQEDWLKEYIEC